MDTHDRPPQSNAESGALTLTQFCERYNVNRVTLFRLRREGLGPDEINIGRKVLITHRAAVEWERRMEERTRTKRTSKQQSAAAA